MKHVIIALTLALASCGQSMPSLANHPDASATANALRPRMAPIGALLSTGPAEHCEGGQMSGRAVQVCDFCETAVALNGEPLAYGFFLMRSISVVRTRVRATFAKAVSLDQPDVEPAGAGGVWVIIGDTSLLSVDQDVTLPLENIRQMGFEVENRSNMTFGGTYLVITRGNNRELSSTEFINALRSASDQSPLAIIPACT